VYCVTHIPRHADDSFATIAVAVREGRGVYDNLRKLLMFALPTNFAQGFCIVAAMVIGMPTPLVAIQVRQGCYSGEESLVGLLSNFPCILPPPPSGPHDQHGLLSHTGHSARTRAP
jgi:hypothetical protein